MIKKQIQENSKLEDSSIELKIYKLYILLGAVIILWGISLWIVIKTFANWADRGTFGDSFGAVNSLFSGLAFAGIIYTILLQRKELSLQRQELIETRKELKRSAGAQERSETALKRQADNLKVTAKLNALNTMVNYYGDIMKSGTKGSISPFKTVGASQLRDQYINQIEEILAGKGGDIPVG